MYQFGSISSIGNGRPRWMGDWEWEQGDPVGTITEARADGVTLKVGHTLVIVYAELRDFEDKNKTCGLRIDGDERATFKVCILSGDGFCLVKPNPGYIDSSRCFHIP